MNQAREDRAAAAKARLHQLAMKFLERTAGDIATMRECQAKMAADGDALGELRHLAHRMVGTGATLGFDSLSERAARIEALAEACPPGIAPDDAVRLQMDVALESLEAELRRLT